ncbi:MAG: Replication initiator protein A (RepA) N-terminus [Namikivirus ozawa]|uniref:Replication initiator protein A (RepA) N-terminus n=1 Tax=Bacteriophage sp. TaxID=38018 RepID=A0ABY5TW05_9VIRU|nr:MAG: Replication initiator protein A (RepA) N-terminus [Bacteriophage sp.]
MIKHSVETALVNKFGVRTAAVYERLHDLCAEKARVNADYHDGLFWVRMTHKDFPKVFPYMSESTVSKAIKKLLDEGLVVVGHYDAHNSVVNWYATT